MIIRFTKRAGIYNVGDVAGFIRPHEKKVAADYVSRGIAVEVERDGDAWVPVEGPSEAETDEGAGGKDEGDGKDGDNGPDLGSMKKDELVALAEQREVKVTREDGEDGEPTKADYVRALTDAASDSEE